MHIKNLKISNMGYIKSSDLRFESNNINIIQGANGSGKTTVLAVLYSMFQD
ncbi:AAA family ATPase [Desulfosporosinus youngiae]